MCGFSGIVFANDLVMNSFAGGKDRFRFCSEQISHRGDTDHQYRFGSNTWLSHYRLAFQDPSNGAQPMISADGRHVIVFNGEVYNHLELRKNEPSLRDRAFRTRTDTETLLEGWKILGEELFDKLEGEYAFVILATDGSEFIAHRDRHGVKPLFLGSKRIDTRQFSVHCAQYSFAAEELEFASEIKGLCLRKHWDREGVRRQFVGLFEPIRTPFQGVINIPPGGRFLARKREGVFVCRLLLLKSAPRSLLPLSKRLDYTHVANALCKSVQDRLLSDVELGVYLSGGIDSKAVAFEMISAARTQREVKSFTIGFRQEGYDESTEAIRFARAFGLSPHLIFVDDAALGYSYPLAVYSSELVQPFTNGAAKWWLSRFSRQYVAGVLTGDGADEMFCGYPSYRYAMWWKGAMRARGPVYSITDLQKSLQATPLGMLRRDSLYVRRFSSHADNPWLSGSSAPGTGADFVNSLKVFGAPHPLFGQIAVITESLLGRETGGRWLSEQSESVRSWFGAGLTDDDRELVNPENALALWQNYFLRTHFPVLIANWVGDRMEMANTLEGRTPFLSTQVADVVRNLRDGDFVAGLKEKAVLRKAYRKRLGVDFSNTPKKQFNAPFILCADKLSREMVEEAVRSAVEDETFSFKATESHTVAIQEQEAYTAAHLKASLQTGVALALLDHTLLANKSFERDDAFEQSYLSTGGPCAAS